MYINAIICPKCTQIMHLKKLTTSYFNHAVKYCSVTLLGSIALVLWLWSSWNLNAINCLQQKNVKCVQIVWVSWSVKWLDVWHYYHTMHVVLAWYCYHKSSVHPSVRLSVCLSMTLWYCEHIYWVSSKVITWIISLGSSMYNTIEQLIRYYLLTINSF